MGFQVSGMRKVAAILRARGIKVTEVSGWTTRGRSTFEPRAVVCHWTAATRSITPMLMHGRPGVPGPLCNFELLPGNDGVKLVAAGKANHAGVARAGFTNSVAFGIEAAGPPIGADEMKVYHALVAAICKVYRFPVKERVRDHAGVALPAGRKSDISPKYDMGEFRRRVAALAASSAAVVEQREKRGPRKDGKPWYPGVRRIGMHGKASGPGAFIAMIQERLNVWGDKVAVDGDFGPKTRDAVAAFQKRRGLAPVSGVVGPRTWYALFDKPK
jgi:Putative peptidoglycan binding domain/N-acetylmuramoyl-L-alanine amidase